MSSEADTSSISAITGIASNSIIKLRINSITDVRFAPVAIFEFYSVLTPKKVLESA
jgi:hypothetical protein